MSTAPFHIGLTPELVTDAALELTRESHLMAWSIRDLARRLGVAPSVLYHHVGGKDLIARRVVERVVEGFGPPPAGLPWTVWFRTLLLDLYPSLAAYPGTANWLLMHGPTFPTLMPIVETGIMILRRDGFGDRAPVGYALLLNTAVLTVSLSDDRLRHEEDGPRDHATMMAEFRAAAEGLPGVQSMADDFIAPFARGGETADRLREEYYRLVVDTTIAGLAATLERG